MSLADAAKAAAARTKKPNSDLSSTAHESLAGFSYFIKRWKEYGKTKAMEYYHWKVRDSEHPKGKQKEAIRYAQEAETYIHLAGLTLNYDIRKNKELEEPILADEFTDIAKQEKLFGYVQRRKTLGL